MIRCKTVKIDPTTHGTMENRILVLEVQRVPAKNARGWKIEGHKKKGHQEGMPKRFGESLAWEVSWLRKGYATSPKREKKEERGALPKEDGDLLRGYQAMHEENFLSSWLRENVEGEEEERERLNEGKSGKR